MISERNKIGGLRILRASTAQRRPRGSWTRTTRARPGPKLKREGIFATVLNPATQDGTEAESKERFLSFRRGLSTSELSLLTRQIATLLEAGLPLVAVLGSLLEQTDSARVRRIFSQSARR